MTAPPRVLPRLLVTGLGGFVGGWVRQLASSAYEIVGLVDEHGAPVDLTDAQAVRDSVGLARPDAVLHLAAQSHVPTSFDQPAATFQVNLLGTLHLLQALDCNAFQGCCLMVSSGDTYGLVDAVDLPIDESQPQRPRSPYAVSKVAAEALCWQWSQTQSAYRVVTARAFNHIGPGQDPRFAVADFARQVARIRSGRQEPRLLTGDIDASRDFTDVRDVVAAYLQLLTAGRNGRCYNVCSGTERTLRDIIQQLCALAEVTVAIEQDPSRLRPSEQRRVAGNPNRIHSDTGWTPALTLTQTLRDTLAWWNEKDNE